MRPSSGGGALCPSGRGRASLVPRPRLNSNLTSDDRCLAGSYCRPGSGRAALALGGTGSLPLAGA